MDEEREEQSPELRELQEERFKLTELKKQPGWAWLMQVAKVQLDSRKGMVLLRPLASMDEVLSQEFAKGEISGIQLFVDLVDLRVADLSEQIEERLNEDSATDAS